MLGVVIVPGIQDGTDIKMKMMPGISIALIQTEVKPNTPIGN